MGTNWKVKHWNIDLLQICQKKILEIKYHYFIRCDYFYKKDNCFYKNIMYNIYPTHADREFLKQSQSSTIHHNHIKRTETHMKTFAHRIIIMPFPINIHKMFHFAILFYYDAYFPSFFPV